MLKRNSFNVHWKFGACQKWEPAGRIVDFGIFWTVLLKAHVCFARFWKKKRLNECNLSWKIVKHYILSEVCMIKTAPHITVSPQMWCIRSMKCWFRRTQIVGKILFRKLVESKKFGLICSPRIRFPGLIYCDQEP